MAPFAIGQRECHCPVAATAILTIQNIKHAELGCASLVFEDLFVTITANQPFGVLLVRKFDHVHLAGV